VSPRGPVVTRRARAAPGKVVRGGRVRGSPTSEPPRAKGWRGPGACWEHRALLFADGNGGDSLPAPGSVSAPRNRDDGWTWAARYRVDGRDHSRIPYYADEGTYALQGTLFEAHAEAGALPRLRRHCRRPHRLPPPPTKREGSGLGSVDASQRHLRIALIPKHEHGRLRVPVRTPAAPLHGRVQRMRRPAVAAPCAAGVVRPAHPRAAPYPPDWAVVVCVRYSDRLRIAVRRRRMPTA
jgi:hypothetical protein